MSGVDDLVRWLGEQLDADALWATEASRRYGHAAHESGVHWQWVEPETDTPVTVEPSRDEHLTDDAGNFRFALRSVEEFPREHVGPLPLFAISSAEEIPAGVAGHIVTHDPARVLREIDAKRQILRDLEQVEFTLSTAGPDTPPHDLMTGAVNLLRRTVRLHAEVYEDRPGYQETWRP